LAENVLNQIPMSKQTDQKAKVYDIVKGFSTAMFVTLGTGGRPTARPMHMAHIDEEAARIWFFTSKGGSLVDELQKEAVTLLVFQNENSAYLSLRGRAKPTQGATKIKELWKEPYKVWFPEGPDDPNIALIAFDPSEAEYWDNRGLNKLEYMFESARAYIKGETPNVTDIDQHGKTKL
jgi:general stress protein 26